MKRVTKPAEREEATYYSDFTGKCFGEWGPPVELKLDFGYGSEHDGSSLTFHLDDEDVKNVLACLKINLSSEVKKHFKNQCTKLSDDYEDTMQMRDWSSCDTILNQRALLTKLVD